MSVREIEWIAFSGCESLAELYLPKNVCLIGEGAFSESGIQRLIFEDPCDWYFEDEDEPLSLASPTAAAEIFNCDTVSAAVKKQ